MSIAEYNNYICHATRAIFSSTDVYIYLLHQPFFWGGGAALGTRQSIARGTPTYCTHYVYTVILYSNPVINIRTIKRSCLLVSGGIRMYNIVNDNNIVRLWDRTRVDERRERVRRRSLVAILFFYFTFPYYARDVLYETDLLRTRADKTTTKKKKKKWKLINEAK